MKLNELSPPEGAKTKRTRKGRGQGSGKGGHTVGRGSKGQKSRSGASIRPGFEGGQMPLHRRLPKRGFKNPFRTEVAEVNVQDLARFEAGSTVDAQALAEAGLLKGSFDAIKLLGKGEITVALTVQVDRASEGAVKKIESAGGKVELI